MAQPVFDGHPLEEYFRDSVEASEVMPGGIADFLLKPYLTGSPSTFKYSERMERLCYLIFGAFESLSLLFSPNHLSLRAQAFAERFKYGVISSSLLSPSFSATPVVESHRLCLSQSFPGKLPKIHSRTPSVADSTTADSPSFSMPPEPGTSIWPLTLTFTVALAALSARFYFFALLLLAGTLYYMRVHRLDVQPKPDIMTPSLLALQHLISAGQLWDAIISDTFTLLENEERNIFYGPASLVTPSSSLRVALSTSLLTTQTQCDNVRQLLSAITSPPELAQLAEMYAPPSPIKPTFSPSNESHRPLSHPGSSPRAASSMDRMRKRSTWNGSYTSVAFPESPPATQLKQRRGRRRSDLSSLLGSASPTPANSRSRRALSSPPQPLEDVSEEEGMVTTEPSLVEDEENSFGAAALSLYRKRASGGLRTLELSQRCTPRGNLSKSRTTMSPGSKYTSMRTTRHPFSLSSLHQSLQSALASKRFACSHLLALRFEDDEDDVYWEDVRSVMSLLTSTLLDASSRLSEALDEVEEHHLKADDTPPESISGLHTPSSVASPPPARTSLPLSHAVEQIASFAPMPSHLARFASHVDAISTALDDAREQLAQCVAAFKDEHAVRSPSHSSHPSTSSCGDAPGSGAGAATGRDDPTEHPAIQAYERLRRELGLALRECERGRERLVHLVSPRTPTTDEEPLDDTKQDALPALLSSLPPSRSGDDNSAGLTILSPSGAPLPLDPDTSPDPEPGQDDATAQLLVTASAAHLPPPGIEQVFETETGDVGAFTRMRSTLSREERIRRVKAQREARASLGLSVSRLGHDPFMDTDPDPSRSPPSSPPTSPPGRERWGPSTDVVQELRDVIWKVGQRRHKMTESQLKSVVSSLPTVSSVGVDVGLVPQSARMES